MKYLLEFNSHKHKISLHKAIELSQISDIKEVGEWLNKPIDQINYYYKMESIDMFMDSILEMESTYDEFLEDKERTDIIYDLLKNGNNAMPIFVELDDIDKFVMEGRHRMVAFYWLGLEEIPVIYVD